MPQAATEHNGVQVPKCTFCHIPATRLMPQMTAAAEAGTQQVRWVFVLACPDHVDGWWDGDDPVASNYPVAPHGYLLKGDM